MSRKLPLVTRVMAVMAVMASMMTFSWVSSRRAAGAGRLLGLPWPFRAGGWLGLGVEGLPHGVEDPFAQAFAGWDGRVGHLVVDGDAVDLAGAGEVQAELGVEVQ